MPRSHCAWAISDLGSVNIHVIIVHSIIYSASLKSYQVLYQNLFRSVNMEWFFFIWRSLLITIFIFQSKARRKMNFLMSEIAFESHVPLNQKSQILISIVSTINIKSCVTSSPCTANQTLDPALGNSISFPGKCLNQLLTVMNMPTAVEHATPWLVPKMLSGA